MSLIRKPWKFNIPVQPPFEVLVGFLNKNKEDSFCIREALLSPPPLSLSLSNHKKLRQNLTLTSIEDIYKYFILTLT